jgi:pimeloyl-ACP methyl ester carboxylesterase
VIADGRHLRSRHSTTRDPLIVLLPSRGRGSEDFDDVAAGIAAAGYRVLRPQPRGAGASRGPDDGIGMADLARDVAMTIEREAAGRAVIAGHAFGSWIARMTATAFPHVVSGIVLMAAASRHYPPELHAVVEAAGDASRPAAERLAALRTGFFAPGHDPAPWLEGWAPEAIRIQKIAVAATPQSTYWQAGDVPLLDLVAEHDPFKPRARWQETIEDFGTRASVKLIADASHALLPEQPQAVVDAIVAWMRVRPTAS